MATKSAIGIKRSAISRTRYDQPSINPAATRRRLAIGPASEGGPVGGRDHGGDCPREQGGKTDVGEKPGSGRKYPWQRQDHRRGNKADRATKRHPPEKVGGDDEDDREQDGEQVVGSLGVPEQLHGGPRR